LNKSREQKPSIYMEHELPLCRIGSGRILGQFLQTASKNGHIHCIENM